MVLPSKTIDLVILDQKYTATFPNTGQFIDIQALKGRLASDNYNQLSNSTDQYTGYAMLLVDMIATFNILIPDLKKNMNVQSILSLNMLESKVLLNTYLKSWIPFYTNWMDLITAAETEGEVKNEA